MEIGVPYINNLQSKRRIIISVYKRTKGNCTLVTCNFISLRFETRSKRVIEVLKEKYYHCNQHYSCHKVTMSLLSHFVTMSILSHSGNFCFLLVTLTYISHPSHTINISHTYQSH